MFGTENQNSAKRVRPSAVAGTFYPDDARILRREITRHLRDNASCGPMPKALIVPHAGYPYSGPVAASGYALLKPIRRQISRVVLLGPSHRVAFYGLATTRDDAFATPLGLVPIDLEGVKAALKWRQVRVLEQAHQYEHSLEVQLPFLQLTLDTFCLTPLCIGKSNAIEVANVIDSLWADDGTLIVVSSDLSHYHDYATARAIDSETSAQIEHVEWHRLNSEQACGYCGIRGLLKVVKQRGLHVKTIDLRNSGDTAGMKDEVVGYGSYVVY